MKHNPVKFFSIFFLLFLISTESSALNVQLFHPLIGQRNQGLTVYGSDGLRKNQVETGVYFNLAKNPLEFTLMQDNRVDNIVDDFATVDFLFSYGLTDWFTFRFDVPVNPYSNVEPIGDYRATDDWSLGDLRFSGTLNLYRTYDSIDNTIQRAGVALVPFVTVPMKNQDDFFGESSWTGGGLLAIDRHLGKRHYIGLNLGARIREREQILNLVVSHEAMGAISYVYRLSCKDRLDLVVEGEGSTTFREFLSQEISSPFEVFLGLRKQSKSQHWEWSLGGGRGGNNGYGAPDYHFFTGVSYLFFKKTEPRKHCCEAREKEPLPVPVAQPIVPVAQPLGSIHIEIADSNGNAVVLPIQVYRNKTLIVEKTSNRIRQPLEVGRYWVEIKPGRIIIETFEVKPQQEMYKKIIIPVPAPPVTITKYIKPIYFDSSKDTIKPESFTALDEVVSIIQQYPDIKVIQIEAHTDSQGKATYNLNLSNERAKSAKAYLVKKGVDASKITATGFGEVRPVDTNETLAGRAKNRRVEFLIESPSQNIKIIQSK